MERTIAMLGTFDSKGREFAFLREELRRRDVKVLAVNTGVLGTTDLFPIHTEADRCAAAGGTSLAQLRAVHDRGEAMKVMCAGASKVVRSLCDEGKIHGIIGMGGGGGTSIATTAMQGLPVGFPKVCITTLASGDTTPYVGTKDILLFPSIVDISGINRFSRSILSRAAGAVCGMAALEPQAVAEDKPIIFLSMFGNSTQCVEQCAALLEEKGYDSMVFHATGTGGRAMEELILEGYCAGVLDITTTEWADELCEGVLTAGTTRLDAAGKMGIPQVIGPGCVDMVNFGPMDTVPAKFRSGERKLYEWNPMVTLMRTTPDENRRIGEVFAEKADQAAGPVVFLFPTKGYSILGGAGECFFDPNADQTLLDTVRGRVRGNIPVEEVAANINDPAYAQRAVELLCGMLSGG